MDTRKPIENPKNTDAKKENKDHLMTIFSFLKPIELSQAASVSKAWKKTSDHDLNWAAHIKSEYKERQKSSRLSAKLFFMQNVDARITFTFYLVAKRIPIEKNCQYLTKFIAAIGEQKEFIAFEKKADAIRYADEISFEVNDDNFPLKPGQELQEYSPVFTAQVKSLKDLKPAAYPARNRHRVGPPQDEQLSGTRISLDNIETLSHVCYKAGPVLMHLINNGEIQMYELEIPKVKQQVKDFLAPPENRKMCTIL